MEMSDIHSDWLNSVGSRNQAEKHRKKKMDFLEEKFFIIIMFFFSSTPGLRTLVYVKIKPVTQNNSCN